MTPFQRKWDRLRSRLDWAQRSLIAPEPLTGHCAICVGLTEPKQTERMLWTNQAALRLRTSTHITPTQQPINLKRSLCQLKFKVPCHFQSQVLMDARNVSLTCINPKGGLLCVFVLLSGNWSQSKQPAFDKHTSILHKKKQKDLRWDTFTVRRNLKHLERFLRC